MSKFVTLHGFGSYAQSGENGGSGTGGVGSAGEINFAVVGGLEQPSNPVENTIWVYTSDEITSWVFGSQQPTSPVEGMVWFATVVDSNITFNAVKENELNIYPITAKQYIEGAFISKDASIYQEGQWRAWWNGVVFNNGTDYVGGFTINAGGATASVGNTIYIYRDRVDGSGSVKSNRPVYVRAYTSLKFTMSASWASYGSSYIESHAVVTVSVVDSETNTTVASKSMNGSNMSSGTHTIPITPPGNFYIVVSAYTYSHYGVINISISDIHFE